MRRISKARPPPNVSPDGQAPVSLQAVEKQLKAALPSAADPIGHARTQFDCLDKRKLRAVLFTEQRHVCVYCESRIKEKGSTVPSIEHWRPLSSCPDLALHWKNMYLSCAVASTCNGSKADRRLVCDEADDDLPWPADAPYEEWIGFTSLGEAYVRVDAPFPETRREALRLAIRSILNLNDPVLRRAREAAIDGERDYLKKAFPGRHATDDERRSRVDALLAASKFSPYVSIAVAYLMRTLGKHQEPVP